LPPPLSEEWRSRLATRRRVVVRPSTAAKRAERSRRCVSVAVVLLDQALCVSIIR